MVGQAARQAGHEAVVATADGPAARARGRWALAPARALFDLHRVHVHPNVVTAVSRPQPGVSLIPLGGLRVLRGEYPIPCQRPMTHDADMNDTTTTQTEATQPHEPWPGPLVRRRQGRVIGGVAAGISDRFGIGTGWVRAAFVIATFFGGAGLVLYIVGWLAIPEEGETESIAASKVVDLQGASRWIGVALIVIGGLLVLGLTNTVNGSLVWAAAFVLAGVLLYRGELPSGPHERGRPRPASPGAAGSMATPVAPANVPASDVVEVEAPVAAVSSPTDEPPPYAPMPPDPPAPPPPIPPSPKKQRSVLGRVTLAVMLLAVGTIAILDNAGTIEPSARHYLGAVVSVAGLGLIVGTWFGRARLLIAIGLLLLPALFVASVVRLPFSGDFGDKTFRPASISEVRDEYRIGAGRTHHRPSRARHRG